jgi:hypothetical protein
LFFDSLTSHIFASILEFSCSVIFVVVNFIKCSLFYINICCIISLLIISVNSAYKWWANILRMLPVLEPWCLIW